MVIPDGADATNAGSPGDSTHLLREMLRQKVQCRALLTIVDPESVQLACQAGIGQTIPFSLGGKRSPRYNLPLDIAGKVSAFSDGRFELKGHLAMKVNMGRCAVLEIGSIRVLVSEFAGPGHDPEVYRHIGLEPADAQIVVVKATVGHMDAYAKIMKDNLPCECPGPSPSYLDRLEYKFIPRPMYPFDADMQWGGESRRLAVYETNV
jgi:microcystin degradation protein MlrC